MLPPDVKSLTDLVQAHPGNDALLRALLVLLQNAPDSAVITEALQSIAPAATTEPALRVQAAKLLSDANAAEAAQRWQPEKVVLATPVSNVVALRPVAGDGTAEKVRKNFAGTLTFADIGGLEDVKSQIRRKILKPFENPGLFQRFKRRAGGGVLMYGPPGCGKTMIARALANECSAQFIEAKAADILDMYKGVAEKRILSLFESARARKPSVLFFDEVEALAQRRGAEAYNAVNTITSALLTEMDGFAGHNEGILFLGATNVPWSLDSAFRRPGRFDRMIFVPPPDRVARSFILKRLLTDRPVAAGLNTERIVEKTTGFSGADLEALVEAAVDYAIEDSGSSDAPQPIGDEHFAAAFREVRSSTGAWLGEAQTYSEYAAKDGMYDDLRDFLKKYRR